MQYKVNLTKKAVKQLKKLDKHTAREIYNWIVDNLDGCTNPRQHGKGLVGDRSGEWRYRVGNYRIIATIHDDIVTIEVFQIEHRSTVYKLKR
ncbi:MULTISPECIES: type II toxin-antitoxin system RelE/ParE family toxin [Streptococcus]|uniref:Plasmid stabilization system n=1 Tax=Streptococcus suis TaxID=1307 RepID=A0A116LLN8_STRSU|nr:MULTISPECIES: type II toxin-antitoxin system RelE/ParE family toxin [Streptococcus]QBX30852.1 RelE/StbE replicon stabilization toxin [Streptococcus phage Javan576]MCL4916217.1 type II toxin-antitoxin system RelE/ParE family toxin [Streptococcus suis]MDY5636408.1 type II toxin-antitoxin system RelE/ParE family toxin [Streptococcus orisratti]NQH67057.1 type II toxin-antitoxin system RelE/ParE family toxin [Streptococcus suis]NQH79475.1 type II toxin-antitoxin system RelE/ParE family toxin [St